MNPVRSDIVEDLDTSSYDGLGNTSSSSDESAGAVSSQEAGGSSISPFVGPTLKAQNLTSSS